MHSATVTPVAKYPPNIGMVGRRALNNLPSVCGGVVVLSKTEESENKLLLRLQELLYEYHELGRFEEARPHILWLMEIAEKTQGLEQRSAA